MVSSSSQNIILGIDPGYDRIGWAIGKTNDTHSLSILGLGCIQTSRKLTLAQRYVSLAQELATVLDRFQPQILAIESLFFARNRTTALAVSEARGVILYTCAARNMAIFEYTPAQVKQAATGSGRADKTELKKMLQRELHLPLSRVLDDAVDALALVLTHNLHQKLARFVTSHKRV